MTASQRAARQIASDRGAFGFGLELPQRRPPGSAQRACGGQQGIRLRPAALKPWEREIRWRESREEIPGQGTVPSWHAYETHPAGRQIPCA